MATWVRVRDRSTGHQYDVAEAAVDGDVHEVVDGYPANTGETAQPRPPKYAQPRVEADKSEGHPATTKKEVG